MSDMRIVLVALALFASAELRAAPDCTQPAAVCETAVRDALALIDRSQPAQIVADANDFSGVLRAARELQGDLAAVSGTQPAFSTDAAKGKTAIIVGTLGKSARIDRIVRDKRIDTRGVAGQWEGYLLQVVEKPEPGIDRALLIAGADKRGTIFGIYELSRRIGVSPWHWWADVPVPKHATLHVAPGRFVDAPAVKYRGIFINDEDPALGGWVNAKFGGPNHKFYEHVFELILRQKGNYLWPAMWPPRAFNDDDPKNQKLADEMGVVMGTSHHEPMMRAHAEWERHGKGPWDYTKNAENLREFWRGGIERMGDNESVVTIGMRGDGDEAMSEGTAISLLERIVADQRKIIAEVTGKPAEKTPQVWALYKEVQDYYDQGMQVPDDVTLLFADDNWGNIRRLPKPGDKRPGGYGVYYHFDYVGTTRNYKWLNVTQIERVWEQMNLAYAQGARQLWVVNVGDIKPMEFPISFFLDQAWNPEAMSLDAMTAHPARWAAEQFGAQHAQEIGDLLTRYTQYSARRTPELIDADTWDLASGEADRIEAEWNDLAARVEAVKRELPAEMHDAFFQLLEYPVLALANLNSMYIAQAKNRRDAAQGLASANHWADEVQRRFARDAELQRIYEQDIASGKWPHMMSQTRIGYTGWQQPEKNVLPATVRVVANTKPAKRTVAPLAPACEIPADARGFVECNGVVAIEAEHHARAVGSDGVVWITIPNLGRTLSGVTSWPQTAQESTPAANGPHLEYPLWLRADGEVELRVTLSPSLDFRGKDGLHFGVSIGDEIPQIVSMKLEPAPTGANTPEQHAWNKAVSDRVHVAVSRHRAKAGAQTLKLWRIDPGVVFQRIEIVRGGVKPSYLGAPESPRR